MWEPFPTNHVRVFFRTQCPPPRSGVTWGYAVERAEQMNTQRRSPINGTGHLVRTQQTLNILIPQVYRTVPLMIGTLPAFQFQNSCRKASRDGRMKDRSLGRAISPGIPTGRRGDPPHAHVSFPAPGLHQETILN